jgi:hypothetical protein
MFLPVLACAASLRLTTAGVGRDEGAGKPERARHRQPRRRQVSLSVAFVRAVVLLVAARARPVRGKLDRSRTPLAFFSSGYDEVRAWRRFLGGASFLHPGKTSPAVPYMRGYKSVIKKQPATQGEKKRMKESKII